MSGAAQIGAVGLRAQQIALDTIANNIANINTGAFKSSDVQFAEIVADRSDSRSPERPAPFLSGVGTLVRTAINGQGEIQRTGQALDLAVEGRGFIELLGAEGQTLLWRGGRLRILEDGTLASASGLPLKANIILPADAVELAIASDGTVSTKAGDEVIELGHITLLTVKDETSITRKMDGGIFMLDETSDAAEAEPEEDGAGRLIQGAIERSAVSLNDEMVKLLVTQRAYAANAQVVQAADQIASIINGLRR